MEILNVIGVLIGVTGGIFGLMATIFRSQNKVVSNDLIHSMKLEELTSTNENFSKRIDALESRQANVAITLAEMSKDLHFIAETIKNKTL